MVIERQGRADIAASLLGTAALSVNAVPVWGQFASIGLGIAAGLTKLFGQIQGPKKKRAKRRAAAQATRVNRQQGMQQAQQQGIGAGGQLNTGQTSPINTPTMGAPPATPPVFGGGVSPQQTLNGNT